jgi:ABC-type uncharacterized transport system substrate-binding protein
MAGSLLLLALCGRADAENTQIVLLASSRSALYEDFIAAYLDDLQPHRDVEFTTLYLDDDQFSSTRIETATDLLVTVGTSAAQYAADSIPEIPVLNTLIPGSSFRALVPQARCDRQSAIFIDQPIQRQALLAGLLFPDARKYGVLLGPTSGLRRTEIEAIHLSEGASIEIQQVQTEPGTTPEAQRLLKQSDLLLAVSDPLVLNRENAKWLLYTAYQQQLPVIGFSRAYVHAGAAAAVFSEAGQMARQAAELTSHWLGSAARCLPEPQYTRYFSVAVNRAVCESLGGKTITETDLVKAIQEKEQAP